MDTQAIDVTNLSKSKKFTNEMSYLLSLPVLLIKWGKRIARSPEFEELHCEVEISVHRIFSSDDAF